MLHAVWGLMSLKICFGDWGLLFVESLSTKMTVIQAFSSRYLHVLRLFLYVSFELWKRYLLYVSFEP